MKMSEKAIQQPSVAKSDNANSTEHVWVNLDCEIRKMTIKFSPKEFLHILNVV